MLVHLKLKGGALYISVIISILISIVLSLFIVIAYFNTRTVQSQGLLDQLKLSLESGFEIAQSNYYNSTSTSGWQKMPYNNDSIQVKKLPWGCFTLIDVKAKNKHFNLHKTGLFGCLATPDTAIILSSGNRATVIGDNVKVNGFCFIPKPNTTNSGNLSQIDPFIKNAPVTIPEINESFAKDIEKQLNQIDPFNDSLVSDLPLILNHTFSKKTAVIQQHSLLLRNLVLTNNVKIVATDVITVDNNNHLNNVLLIARKVIFKKGFKGNVHVIAKDSIITENECEFLYPSSFCAYSNINKSCNGKGIYFGEMCKFEGSILAVSGKQNSCEMSVVLNSKFQIIGNIYSSHFSEARGNIYGTLVSRSLRLITQSGKYDDYIMSCNINPKKYSKNLVVSTCFNKKYLSLSCAKWF